MSDNPRLSIIIPVRNEVDNVVELYRELTNVLGSHGESYEILFIDDGSTDDTYSTVKGIKDDRVNVVSFRRNFGKAAALSCGFSRARGDLIITMDGDLQDDPKEIPRFVEGLGQYDVVSGWKFDRKDPMGKTLPSRVFNYLTRMLTGVRIHDFNCGFKGYKKQVVKNVKIYGELHRYIPALAYWKGFSIGEIKVNHRPRLHGKSKYGVKRIAIGFLDLVTVKFLISYAQKPLHIFGSLGILLGGLGGLICLYLTVLHFLGQQIGERPLLTLGILLIILGIQFVSIGLIGELIVNSRDTRNWTIREE